MQEYFSGRLNGYNVSDLYDELDYDTHSLDDRMDIVEDVVDTGFFNEYFTDYYNPHPNKNSPLSEENNVCRLLESLATYILMSDEEKERRIEKDEVHHSFQGLIKKINRDESLESIATDGDVADMIIYTLEKSDVSKIAQNKKIHIKDLTKDNIGDIIEYVGMKDTNKIDMLKSYMEMYESLNNSTGNKIDVDRSRNSIRRDIETLIESEYPDIKHNNLTINSDSVFIEETKDLGYQHSLLGVTFYNTRRGAIEYEPGLLFHQQVQGVDINDDLDLLLYELDGIIKDSGLSDREKLVLELLRQGKRMGEIAEILHKSANTITKDKQSIVEKVLQQCKQEEGLNGWI